MTATRTRFDDAQFDENQFDATGLEDFGTDVQTDIDEILKEIGQWFHIVRLVTTLDAQGRVSDVSEKIFNVYGLIEEFDSTQTIENVGVVAKGDARVFLKHKYELDAGLESPFIPKEGDVVRVIENRETNDDEDDGLEVEDFKRWKITKLSTRPAGFRAGFIIAYLKRIDNEGSRE